VVPLLSFFPRSNVEGKVETALRGKKLSRRNDHVVASAFVRGK